MVPCPERSSTCSATRRRSATPPRTLRPSLLGTCRSPRCRQPPPRARCHSASIVQSLSGSTCVSFATVLSGYGSYDSVNQSPAKLKRHHCQGGRNDSASEKGSITYVSLPSGREGPGPAAQ